mgnify:CR=1 FL=1
METKINIADILKDKPQGTKLYDWLHNIDVELDTISTTDTETVVWCTNETNNNTTCHRGYSEFGTERGYPDGLQILFPSKEMRDWAKFSWKKGDVLANGKGDYCVFKEFAHSSYQTSKAVFVKCNKESIHSDSCLLDTKDWHKASHSCTATYINTIEKELSGKLNMETLEIEKAQPEFKDGDIVVTDAVPSMCYSKCIFILKGDLNTGESRANSYVFFNINNNHISYDVLDTIERDRNIHLATDSEKQQLFDAIEKDGKAWDAEKKQIVDIKKEHQFKPFEKVLVRDSIDDVWRASFFSHIKENDGRYVTTCVTWKFCIPYIGNESLVGTTKDVEG